MEQREQAHKGTLEERRGGAEGGLTLPGASRKPTKPDAMLIPLRQALNQQVSFSLLCSRTHVNLDRVIRVG